MATQISNGVNLQNKKIAMVIAFKEFRDREYFVPKEILEKAGAEIITVSSALGMAIGADGGEVKIDKLVSETKAEDYEAVVFIGGPGSHRYLDDAEFHRLAQETMAADKVLASICFAGAILAKAGVLHNKRATVWSSPLDKSAIKILQNNGAFYQSEDVVRDGKLITANGPAAAEKFGQKIIETLTEIQ